MSDYKPSAGEIKELRTKTLAGFQNCKNALVETAGDMQAAIDLIRKKGMSVAAKKAHREAAEGIVAAIINDDYTNGAMVEVNCESDFVAKGDIFQELSKEIANTVCSDGTEGPSDADTVHAIACADGKTVKEHIDAVIGTMGENMGVKQAVRYVLNGSGVIHSYIHPPGKVGVLIELGCENGADKDKCVELAHELALQVAFSDPSYVSPDNIPEDVVAKEREIAEGKAREQGKPDHIVPKIVEGMLRKFYSEECLLEQPYAKDTNKSIKDLLKESGLAGATVNRFARFALK